MSLSKELLRIAGKLQEIGTPKRGSSPRIAMPFSQWPHKDDIKIIYKYNKFIMYHRNPDEGEPDFKIERKFWVNRDWDEADFTEVGWMKIREVAILLKEPYRRRVKALGLEVATVDTMSYLPGSLRGKGYGSYLYDYAFNYLLAKGTLLLPSACKKGGLTSPLAMQVWQQLKERQPYLKWVLDGVDVFG